MSLMYNFGTFDFDVSNNEVLFYYLTYEFSCMRIFRYFILKLNKQWLNIFYFRLNR